MNGSTKILTVSYGTFSCTLEGFDDPLSSMREIAEYFRDLAADDRYFGAEPPTPDVEMLQNIAEKEVQRRVEARVSETGVSLVATDAAVAPQVEKASSDDDTKGPLTFDDDFLMSDEPEDVLAVDPDATPAAQGPAESVAEKLRRIRAVVSRSVEAEESQSFSRQQTPFADGDPKRDRALTETIQQITADLTDDEDAVADTGATAETELVADEPVFDSDDIDDAEIDVIDEIDDADEIETAEIAVQASIDDDRSEFDANDLIGRVRNKARSDTADAEPEVADASADDDVHDVEAEDAKPANGASNDDIHRSVSDALGKIASGLVSDDTTEEIESVDDAPKQRVTTRILSPEPEQDVGRLLDETDHKLNEDDTVRRRRVISQMRAAVAATKADRLVSRQVSREDAEEAEKDPYREDLSEAVQKTPANEQTRKPSTAPPLMLVSSQRIHAEEKVEPEPQASDNAEAPQGFAAFAESVGAKELHELLEAAAAYTVFAEGQSSFTRPEIMKRVARMDPTIRLSREDGLRSFGQLLRQGKFKKLERGQFTIDEDTKFNPEQRFVGQ